MDKKQHLIDVQPIRSKEQLEDMKWSLKRHCSDRDYILFLIGINTGLRVSDLLKMETIEILKLKRKKRKEFKVKEGKTKKERIINITSIFEEVLPYAEDLKVPGYFLLEKVINLLVKFKPIDSYKKPEILPESNL